MRGMTYETPLYLEVILGESIDDPPGESLSGSMSRLHGPLRSEAGPPGASTLLGLLGSVLQ